MGPSHYGAERHEAGLQKDQRLVRAELGRLKWSEEELRGRPKGHPGKLATARRLRRETVMSLQWIAQRLETGTWTYGTRSAHRATISVNGAWHSTPDSWICSSSAPYDDTFLPIQQGLLFKYDYNRSVAIYHCPADRSTWRCPKPFKHKRYRKRVESPADLADLRRLQEATLPVANFVPQP